MLTWVAQSSPWGGVGNVNGVCWSPQLGLFVAVGESNDDGKSVATSLGGSVWTSQASPFDGNECRAVCWSAPLGLFVAVGWDGSTNSIASSLDGLVWTGQGSPGSEEMLAVAWDDAQGIFVAGGDSAAIATSPDGLAWTLQTSPFDGGGCTGVCWASGLGLWIAVSLNGNGTEVVMTSPDAAVWTTVTTPFDTGEAFGVCWSSRLALAVVAGNDPTSVLCVMTSSDAITWEAISSPMDNGRGNGVADVGTILVLVGNPGATASIVESPDGSAWTADTSPFDLATGGYGLGVCSSPELGIAVAVGQNGGGPGSAGIATAVLPAPPVPAVRFALSRPWRFVVTDRNTRTLTFLDRLAMGRSVKFPLDGPAIASMRVPSESTEVNILHTDGVPFVSNNDRLLYGFRRDFATADSSGLIPWTVRFAGIIEQVDDAGDAERALTTITAYDPWQYLFNRPVVIDSVGTLPPLDGKPWFGTPSALIVNELLVTSVASHGPVGIDIGLPPGNPSGTIAGGGTLFWDGTIDYGTAPVDITFQRGQSVGDALLQLIDTGTLDILLTPVYDPVNRPGYMADLTVLPQAGSARYDAVFSWDKPGRSLTAIDRLTDGAQLANEIQYYAGKGGYAVPALDTTFPTAQDTTSIARYGRYWATKAYDGANAYRRGGIGPALVALADADLLLRKNGKETVTFTPAPERAPEPFLDYWLGDRVPVYASKRLRKAIP